MSVICRSTRLEKENNEFAGTGGVSPENSYLSFIPAFMNQETGRVVISCYADGRRAPCHIPDGLPQSWINRWDEQGRVIDIKDTVLSGFVRKNRFYTRQEAADFVISNH